MDAVRKLVKSKFYGHGYQLDIPAMQRLMCLSDTVPDFEDFLQTVLDELGTGDTKKVSLVDVEALLLRLQGAGQQKDVLQVIDAFETPYMAFDPVRKAFHPSTAPRRLMAGAESKLALYMNRLYMLQQRVRRNRFFTRPALGDMTGVVGDYAELSELKALLGIVGESRYVMGFISQPQEGQYALEDLSASVPVDISEAEISTGLYTENCIVVAEGVMGTNNVFKLNSLSHPMIEIREESLQALKGLDLFGGQRISERDADEWMETHEDDRVVIMSDVWLDKPEVMERLTTVFEVFDGYESPPSMFLLLGNFQSFSCCTPSARYADVRENFAALARLINKYPSIASSKFVFVPGSGDAGPGNILPRPGLPAALTQELRDTVPGAVFASNPCRLRLCTRDVVVFRNDLQHKMRGLSIVPPTGDNASPEAVFEHTCVTVLQQSHVCPVPLEHQPVFWEHDHALAVYPLPDALILADSAPAAQYAFEQCACVNPGSLINSTFAAYIPAQQTVELCDVPEGGLEDMVDDE